jgi:hypothetical protein
MNWVDLAKDRNWQRALVMEELAEGSGDGSNKASSFIKCREVLESLHKWRPL